MFPHTEGEAQMSNVLRRPVVATYTCEDERIVDNEGNVWTIDMNDPDYDDWEKFKVDEYGDKAFMWDYR